MTPRIIRAIAYAPIMPEGVPSFLKSMRLYHGLLLPLLLLAQIACAQTSPAPASALLWQISDTASGRSAWLFGTIHLIPDQDFQWPDRLRQTLEDSDHLVLELDMTEAMNPMTQMALLPRMMMPDGVRLRDLLEEADYRLVMDALDATGMPAFLFESLKPLFLTALIEPGMGMGGGLESYDMRLYELAMEKKMKHSGLESIEEQLAAFDAVALEDQARMLVEQLRGGGGEGPGLDELIQAYKTEDLARLHHLMQEQQSMDPHMMDALLYDRNRRWIDRIGGFMQEDRVFFAVGAGHLAGEEGVIRLLEKAGYRLTPHPVFR